MEQRPNLGDDQSGQGPMSREDLIEAMEIEEIRIRELLDEPGRLLPTDDLEHSLADLEGRITKVEATEEERQDQTDIQILRDAGFYIS